MGTGWTLDRKTPREAEGLEAPPQPTHQPVTESEGLQLTVSGAYFRATRCTSQTWSWAPTASLEGPLHIRDLPSQGFQGVSGDCVIFF